MISRVVVLSVVGAAGLFSCQSSTVSASGALMLSSVRGDIGLESPGGNNLASRKFNLDDANLEDVEVRPTARVDVEADRVGFGIVGLYHSEDTSGALPNQFGSIGQGTQATTETEFITARGYVSYDVVEVGPLRLAPAFMLDLVLYDYQVRPQSGSIQLEEVKHELLAPMPGLIAELDFDQFGAIVELGGMNADYGDGEGTIVDLDVRLRAAINQRADLVLGFRYMKLDLLGVADANPYDSDLDFFGYYFGGRVHF